MKRKLFLLFTLASALILGCSDDDKSTTKTTQNDPNEWAQYDNTYLFGSISEDAKAVLPVIPGKTLDNLGLMYPNDIVMNQTHAFIVDSGNNTIHRIALDTLDVEKNFVDLGQNVGPASAYADQDNLYIVCNMTSQVVKVDLKTQAKSVILSADKLISGYNVLKVDNAVIVSDSEYDLSNPSNTKGSLIVIKDDGSINSFDTETPNPTSIANIKVGEKQYIVSSNSGIVQYGSNGEMTAPDKSCIQLWALEELMGGDTPFVKTHCETNSSVGKISVSDTHLYVGDGVTPKVYSTDITKLPDFDIWTSAAFGNAKDLGMTIPLVVGSDLAVFNFNADTLTWVRGDKRINLKLSQTEASKKGPISAIYDANHKQILVLNSLSGSIDVLKIRN